MVIQTERWSSLFRGGNDVYGDYGYAGCKWISQKRFLKTEADRKVAADWPYAQLTRVREGVERLIELRARSDVAELVVVGNAPAEDYDLSKAYNRHLGEHYGYPHDFERSSVCRSKHDDVPGLLPRSIPMIECYQTLKWGVAVYSGIATSAFRTFQVMQYKEEIEPLTILNAGEGEGDLQLMEFMFRYPTISPYACRKASRGSD